MKLSGTIKIGDFTYTLTGEATAHPPPAQQVASIAAVSATMSPAAIMAESSPPPKPAEPAAKARSLYLARIPIVAVAAVRTRRERLPQPEAEPLTKNADDRFPLKYLGGFRVPRGIDWDRGTVAGATKRHSLYYFGNPKESKLAEIEIPPDLSPDQAIQDLPIADVIQGFSDVWSRVKIREKESRYKWATLGLRPGGITCFDGKVIVSVYDFYDGSQQHTRSHFIIEGDDLAGAPVSGCYVVGDRSQGGIYGAGFTGGHSCEIPAAWRNSIGATHLLGLAGVSIHGRTSNGPSAFAWRPADLIDENQATDVDPLFTYPLKHRLIPRTAGTGHASPVWHLGSRQRGLFWPTGCRTIYAVGSSGMGKLCYGPGGTDDRSACYDPINANKGYHSFPYKSRLWSYDARDVMAVIRGERKPWDLLPYQIQDFPIPDRTGRADISSTFDAENQRLYVLQHGAESVRYARYPVIRVYQS